MKKLFDVLSKAIECGVGFEEADALYSESFRYPESFSAAEAPEMLEALQFFVNNNMLSVIGEEVAERLINEILE